MTIFGGIEAGGTRWNCAVGDGGGTSAGSESFATTTPEETIARAVGFFERNGPLTALGVGCFGPLDLDRSSPRWGRITTTPKPGWSGTDVVSILRAGLDVPIAFETDVNAAAVGEAQWGAGEGLETFSYVTVGTGIGGGAVVNGRPLHGLVHPELGHIRVPHDRDRDPFAGSCPFHGDCLEGLASGEALRQRWGAPGEELDAPEVWELEAEYLALGLANLVLTLSPERIIVGGGVAGTPGLLELVRSRLRELLAGYVDVPQLRGDAEDYVVPPALGPRAGVTGAIELARRAGEEDACARM
ncbi:MAG TPA: ROK family protein [Solirubrobacteraceae bacterium]|nr:ROK family protein [Solirubrobacteraceae bacterium]